MRKRIERALASNGRVWWRVLLRGPKVRTPKGAEWTIDEAFIDRQLAQFEAMTERGYRPPVLKEHERRGERFGNVVALEGADENGAWELRAGLQLNEDEWAKVDSGAYEAVSGSWVKLRDDQGVEYEDVLHEVSLVSGSHVKIDQSVHHHRDDAVMMTEFLEEAAVEEIAAQLSELRALMTAQDQRIAAMEALRAQPAQPAPMAEEDPKEDPKEDPEEDPEAKPAPEDEKKKDEPDFEAMSEVIASKILAKMSEGRVGITAMPPQAPSKDDQTILRSQEELEALAKATGKSKLQILGDPNILTTF